MTRRFPKGLLAESPLLDVALPLLHGVTALECQVRLREDRVAVRLRLTRPDSEQEYVMRVGLTQWRGVWLPALRHLCSYNAIPLTLTTP